jgi:diguanylate cyclase (GGDEF)-like protein
MEHLEREINRCQRYKRQVSLIMCDVDYFKKFNDTYGHPAGDKALQIVANIMADNVRTSDLVARYGGEEFAILLVEAGIEQAQAVAKRLKNAMDDAVEVADRIKDKIEKTLIPIDHKKVSVTISMGVSSYDGHKDYKAEYLVSEADHALYESKNSGRNTITIFNPTTKEFKSYSR